jgi:uncharacterized protein YjbI with pentapeptide repeats
MANQEHAALVLQAEAWRRWRNENVDVTPDLRANLRGTNLVNANLRGADLSLMRTSTMRTSPGRTSLGQFDLK